MSQAPSDRTGDQHSDRVPNRRGEQSQDRSAGSGAPRPERGQRRPTRRPQDSTSQNPRLQSRYDQDSQRESQREPHRDSQRDSYRNYDSGRGSEHGSERGSERGSQRSYERGGERDFRRDSRPEERFQRDSERPRSQERPQRRGASDRRDRERPDNRHPNAIRRDKEAKFPLDPSKYVQRGLNLKEGQPIPVARIKSLTRHPTIFRKRIADVSSFAQHGDVVQIKTVDNEEVGYGLWNPRAEATIRVLSWSNPPLNGSFWKERFEFANRARKSLQLEQTTNAYRLINAEGDFLPGLMVDRYENVISLEVFTLAMFQRGEAIAQSIASVLGVKDWIVRPGPGIFEQEGFLAEGFCSPNFPEKVRVVEHGVQYELDPALGHKTGFFCDQRDNRLRLREFCKGKTVLDLCCYTGGFSMNAALAGAKEVTAVDLDEEAIEQAKKIAKLNRANVKFVHADAFSYMRDLNRNGKKFDVVILDPPKLIRGRDEMVSGQEKYFDLNKLAAPLVNSGGLFLTCSCSGLLGMDEFTRTVRAASGERRPQLLLRSGAGLDHPVAMNCLESEYLKCLWLQMD